MKNICYFTFDKDNYEEHFKNVISHKYKLALLSKASVVC